MKEEVATCALLPLNKVYSGELNPEMDHGPALFCPMREGCAVQKPNGKGEYISNEREKIK